MTPSPNTPTEANFKLGDVVRKTKGSEWAGRVVGTYSTTLTPEGYAVESAAHSGSVQIYPASALELVHAAPSTASAVADAGAGAPIDMVLYCPKCGKQHIDAPEPGRAIWGSAMHSPVVEVGGWTNPPHRSHLCHGCGHVWRPADVPTNGVQAVKTKGRADSLDAALPVVQAAPQGADERKGNDEFWKAIKAYGAAKYQSGVMNYSGNFVQQEEADAAVSAAMKNLSAALSAQVAAGQGEPSLPHDVTVGGTTFRKGVRLSTFILAAQRWHREAFPDAYLLTAEQKDENLAALQSGQPMPHQLGRTTVDRLMALADSYNSPNATAVVKIERREALKDGIEKIVLSMSRALSLSAASQPPAGPTEDMVKRLRELVTGRVEWRVQHPVEKSFCVVFTRDDSTNPRMDATEWLADFAAKFPDHPHAKYEVAEVRVYSELEQAVLDALGEGVADA